MNNSSTYNILQKNHLKHHSDCCEWSLQKGEGQNTNRAGKHFNFCGKKQAYRMLVVVIEASDKR